MQDHSLKFSSIVDRLRAMGILLSSCQDGQAEEAAHGAGLIVEGLAGELEELTQALYGQPEKEPEDDLDDEPDRKVRRIRE
jgi:hypothetical protein